MITPLRPVAFENQLQRVFVSLVAVFADHQAHPLMSSSLRLGWTAHHDNQDCPGDTRCEELNRLVGEAVLDAFPPVDVPRYYRDAESLLDVQLDSPVTNLRDAVVETLVHTAMIRLFPDGALRPVDPAGTRELVTR